MWPFKSSHEETVRLIIYSIHLSKYDKYTGVTIKRTLQNPSYEYMTNGDLLSSDVGVIRLLEDGWVYRGRTSKYKEEIES